MKIKIKTNSKNTIKSDLINIELKYNIKLPDEYRNFLINTNGGVCNEGQEYDFINTLLEREDCIELNNFFSIEELYHDLDVIYKTKREDVHPVEDDIFLYKILRIADTYNDLDIGIRLSEEEFGSIYILDTPHGEKIKIANSFDEFINGFEEEDC